MTRKKKVLFVCVHNSARSQMAEAFLKYQAADRYEAESAGLEPGTLNPLVVEVMKEEGIDISANRTKAVMDLYQQGRRFDYVITVCDAGQSERCPVFPGGESRHWSFPDPAGFSGARSEKIEKTRQVREMIKQKIAEWIDEHGKG